MRLTKEEFCRYVNLYELMCKQESAICDSLNIDLEWIPSEWIGRYYELLSAMCGSKSNDLDYYCYDLNFGKAWTPGSITIDGKDVPCRNAEELWDLITMKSAE